jgi:hypothetical protein
MGLGFGIQDPEKTHSGSRIQGSKKHRIRNTAFFPLFSSFPLFLSYPRFSSILSFLSCPPISSKPSPHILSSLLILSSLFYFLANLPALSYHFTSPFLLVLSPPLFGNRKIYRCLTHVLSKKVRFPLTNAVAPLLFHFILICFKSGEVPS